MTPDARKETRIPEPLRASEIPSFTNYSVVVRLPEIARRALSENQFSPDIIAAIEALIAEIPNGLIRPVDTPLVRDSALWAEYIRPYTGMNWLEVPWFFAEEYFYLRILEATRYFHPGSHQGKDPYSAQKRLGLVSTRESIRTLLSQVGAAGNLSLQQQREALHRLLLADLWGNQNDLSMWPVLKSETGNGLTGGKAGHPAAGEPGSHHVSAPDDLRSASQHILADDLSTALDYIDSLPHSSTRIDILLDNAGFELVCDLALADFLLSSQRAAQVIVHAKTHPVFVSDVIEEDFHDTLDFLVLMGDASCKALGIRLREHLVSERLVLRHHPFWTSPLAGWEMPKDLVAAFHQSNLLISKGDANYRRLLGDRHWPVSLPFASVVDYLPCPILALRTLKSEIAVGIPPERFPAGDPRWMTNGRWGTVQFALPRDSRFE